MSADCARSRWELKVADGASTDALGNDADRVEYRYRDANSKMDFKCSRTFVPGLGPTVSHISGPTLFNTIHAVRKQRARVEWPEQFAQLAAVHAPWYHQEDKRDPGRIGCRATFVGKL